jgi:hypothetical protein
MRPQLGPVVSSAAAQQLLTLAQVRAELAPADRAASLVTAPRNVRIVDRERESMRRTERRAGL